MVIVIIVNIVVLVIITIATINIRLAIIIAIIAITKVYFFSSRLLLLAFTHGHYQLYRWSGCRFPRHSSCPENVYGLEKICARNFVRFFNVNLTLPPPVINVTEL